jgi:hypothetical protein
MKICKGCKKGIRKGCYNGCGDTPTQPQWEIIEKIILQYWAYDNYTKAIELDPDDASNYYFRSANYLIKGEKEKYYADLQKALDLGYKPTRLWHERSN